MIRILSFVSLFTTLLAFPLLAQVSDDWMTYYEKSNYLETPRYDQTIDFSKKLADASPWIRYTTFGTSPQGRDLPLIIFSKDGIFTPEKARSSGKAIILIQSGIHSGEIDGKDASLMLLRDLAIRKIWDEGLENVILLFVPIFSVDGHERFGPFNRINQNGPKEMGWRVTAQNLNLNRDYLKADAPEMRAMLKLFSSWLPDFYVDCHVTDGIDFQYDVTYAMEVYQNIDAEIAGWIQSSYLPFMTGYVEGAGHLIAPYIWPREGRDIRSGFVSSPATPRFSTGYAALQNRPALLIETHMLKPYKTRVSATYAILAATIKKVNEEAARLRSIVTAADRRASRLGGTADSPSYLPISFRPANVFKPWDFKGIKSREEPSDISGTVRTIYTGEPEEFVVPHYYKADVIDSALVPTAYLVPPQWTNVIDVLHAHGIKTTTLGQDMEVHAQRYRLSDPQWQQRPYEGRHPVRFSRTAEYRTETFPAGTIVVRTAQRTARVIVNLLEPDAPDSFVRWGFFDSIFEQKEYAEPYVLERMAREMIHSDPQLLVDFRERVQTDSTFARSPYARLNFFYRRSPYWDTSIGLYPVARVLGEFDPSADDSR